MHPESPINNHEKHLPAQIHYLPHTACIQRSGNESISSACTGQARTVVVCQAVEVRQEAKETCYASIPTTKKECSNI